MSNLVEDSLARARRRPERRNGFVFPAREASCLNLNYGYTTSCVDQAIGFV
jgi:hypothetical protein